MPKNPTEAQREASRINGYNGGRPVKTVETNARVKMTIAMSEEELESVRESAKSCNLTLTEFGRRRILGYRIVSKSDQEQTRLLMKITGLLKHIHNESNGAYSAQTAQMLSDVHEVIRELNK